MGRLTGTRVAAVLSLVFVSILAFAQAPAARRYSLPAGATLALEVPDNWKDEVRQPEGTLPPTIEFRPAKGPPFKVLLTPVWPRTEGDKPQDLATVRKLLGLAAAAASAQSVEKELPLQELEGKTCRGFYFSATDRAPKEGEFKFMTQGMTRGDEVVVSFTILTNQGQEGVVAAALEMVNSATYEAGPAPAPRKAAGDGTVAPGGKEQASPTFGPEAFHALVATTYDFHPANLKGKEREEKLDLLDAFWTVVKSDRQAYLPLLRAELSRQDNPSFFYCDGGNLLILNSDAREDWSLVLDGYRHVDMADVSGEAYLTVVHGCAVMGLDTTPAAMRVLTDPTFTAYIDDHAMKLGQGESMLFMLYPRPEEAFLPALLEAVKTENRERELKTLLLLLEVAVTKEADAAIAQIASDASRPEGARKYAQESLAFFEKVKKQKAGAMSQEDLRKQRRDALRRISDEASYEFMDLTNRLRAST